MAEVKITKLNMSSTAKAEEIMEDWGKAPNYRLEFSKHGYHTDDGKDVESLVLYEKIPDSPNCYKAYPIMTEEIFQKCYERWIVLKGLDR